MQASLLYQLRSEAQADEIVVFAVFRDADVDFRWKS